MSKKNKNTAASVSEAATDEEPLATIDDPVEEAPPALPKGVIRVRAVIRPMYAPFSDIMIPDDGPGVFIEPGSWADAQLERGLICKC